MTHTGDWGLLLIGAACACLGLAALLCSLGRRRPTIYRLAAALGPAAGGALATGAALLVLLPGTGATHTLFPILPDLHVEVAAMPLGAVFWLLIGLPALAMGIFALGGEEPALADWPAWATTNLLILTLLALVTVADVLSLLILWQLAATLAVVLVVCRRRDADIADSAWAPARGGKQRRVSGTLPYLPVALQAGGACLLAVFLLLDADCRSLRFAALHACGPRTDPAKQSLIFLLTLAASGIAAVAALLSSPRGGRESEGSLPTHLALALAARVVLYPLVLVPFSFLGPGQAWWGLLLLVLGAAVALTGAIAVLGERSLEAIGIYGGVSQLGAVLLGLGSALLLRPTQGMSTGGGEALGIAAALLCVLAGALGGSLLGLTAQALHQATGSGDLERWGGLLRPIPWTGSLALVGLAGTLVLPVFGGLTGGWLTMQALVAVAAVPASAHVGASAPGIGGVALLAAAVLGLVATLGMAAMVLTYGLGFLGPSRTKGAATAQERPVLVRAALIVLAAPVAVLALAPSGVLAFLHPVLADLAGAGVPGSGALGPLASLPSPPVHGNLFPLGILLCIAGCAGACTIGARRAGHTITTETQRHRVNAEHQGDTVNTASTDGDRVDAWRPPDFPADLAAAPLRRLLLMAPWRAIDRSGSGSGEALVRVVRAFRAHDRENSPAGGHGAFPAAAAGTSSGRRSRSYAPLLLYLSVLALVLLVLVR